VTGFDDFLGPAAAVRLLFDATLPRTVLVGRDGAVVRL
jgi:hypothetical protein